jgi:hypothetical protein
MPVRQPRRRDVSLLLGLSLLLIPLVPEAVEAKPHHHHNHHNHNHWNNRVDHRHRQPSWARQNWHHHRPWRHGWYGPGYVDRWGWWGPRAATWGIGSLATAALINSAVSSAIAAKQPTIVVPETSYWLDYGSVEVPSDNTVTFVVNRDGVNYRMRANCLSGDLNGHPPNDSSEAQLLNAACQVAFGAL